MSDWVFMSHDRWIVRRRSDLGETFAPDSLTWTGPVVATGIVTVTASIDGSPLDSASAQLTVRARAWTKDSILRFPSAPKEVGQGWLPPMPEEVHDLGQIRWWWVNSDVAADTLFRVLITEGPNAFVYFLRKMTPVLDSIHVAYNEIALSKNSAFYLLQEEDNPSRIFNGSNPCFRSDVVSEDTKRKILAHEGTKWELNPVSHAGRMRQLAFARVPAAAESVTAQVDSGGPQGLMDRWHRLVYQLVLLKIDSLANKPVDEANPVYFGAGSRGCTFRYPSPRPAP